jgi:hypothetical protein
VTGKRSFRRTKVDPYHTAVEERQLLQNHLTNSPRKDNSFKVNGSFSCSKSERPTKRLRIAGVRGIVKLGGGWLILKQGVRAQVDG